MAAAMRKLRRMQEEPRIWQKMKRVLVAPGPPLRGEPEFQPIEVLPRAMIVPYIFLPALHRHPNPS